MAAALSARGYKSAEQLAKAYSADLLAVNGVTEQRAIMLIDAANLLLGLRNVAQDKSSPATQAPQSSAAESIGKDSSETEKPEEKARSKEGKKVISKTCQRSQLPISQLR